MTDVQLNIVGCPDEKTQFKDFKRGDLVTIHEGSGGYFAIEKGNTVPQDGKILRL